MLQEMKPGQVIQPMRGPSGFQIVQLVETRAADGAEDHPVQGVATSWSTPRTLVSAEAARQKIRGAACPHRRRRGFRQGRQGRFRRHADRKPTAATWAGSQADAWGTAIGSAGAAPGRWRAVADRSRPTSAGTSIQRIGTRVQDVTDENRRNQARETIGHRKADEEYERYLRQLRGEALRRNAALAAAATLSRRCVRGSRWFRASRRASDPNSAFALAQQPPAARPGRVSPIPTPCWPPRRPCRCPWSCVNPASPAAAGRLGVLRRPQAVPVPLRRSRPGQCPRRDRCPARRRRAPACAGDFRRPGHRPGAQGQHQCRRHRLHRHHRTAGRRRPAARW